MYMCQGNDQKKTEKKQSLFDEFSKAFAQKRLQNI